MVPARARLAVSTAAGRSSLQRRPSRASTAPTGIRSTHSGGLLVVTGDASDRRDPDLRGRGARRVRPAHPADRGVSTAWAVAAIATFSVGVSHAASAMSSDGETSRVSSTFSGRIAA